MKIKSEGSVVSLDFETAGTENMAVDVSAFNDSVKHAAMMFGFQTALRNTTAGKLEELPKALEALKGRVSTWNSGSWLSQAEAKAAVDLSTDEKNAIIGNVIIMARRAQGDTRTDGEILGAFNGLDETRKGAILEALKKPIDKRIKEALRQKKTLAKTAAGAVSF